MTNTVAGALKVWVLSAAIVASPLVKAGAQTIQQRKTNQQQRIAQGVRSGQLTAGETSRLERREAHLNREERAMRHADGGSLTAGDRAQLQKQQNGLSRAIYRDKHNARVQ